MLKVPCYKLLYAQPYRNTRNKGTLVHNIHNVTCSWCKVEAVGHGIEIVTFTIQLGMSGLVDHSVGAAVLQYNAETIRDLASFGQ